MRLLSLIPCVFVVFSAITVVAYQAISADGSAKDDQVSVSSLHCGGNCAFELLYNTFNGDIGGASAWDPSTPYSPQPGSSHVVRGGQATLVFTDHSNAADILEHPDEYYVDLKSKKIKRGSNPQIDPLAWPPTIPPVDSADHIAARMDAHECSPHPCAGWRYAALYRVEDGGLRLITAFDPATTQPRENGHLMKPGEGEALVDVTDDSHLEDVLALVLTGSADFFYLDTDSGEIKVRGGHSTLVLPPRDGSESLQCRFDPCPGFVYELVYSEDSGDINSFGAYAGCAPPDHNCGPRAPISPGSAWINIANDPLLLDFFYTGVDKFRLDITTLRLVPIRN